MISVFLGVHSRCLVQQQRKHAWQCLVAGIYPSRVVDLLQMHYNSTVKCRKFELDTVFNWEPV